jgi:hypothetical protein
LKWVYIEDSGGYVVLPLYPHTHHQSARPHLTSHSVQQFSPGKALPDSEQQTTSTMAPYSIFDNMSLSNVASSAAPGSDETGRSSRASESSQPHTTVGDTGSRVVSQSPDGSNCDTEDRLYDAGLKDLYNWRKFFKLSGDTQARELPPGSSSKSTAESPELSVPSQEPGIPTGVYSPQEDADAASITSVAHQVEYVCVSDDEGNHTPGSIIAARTRVQNPSWWRRSKPSKVR